MVRAGWVGEWVIEHDPDAAIDAAQQKGAQREHARRFLWNLRLSSKRVIRDAAIAYELFGCTQQYIKSRARGA